MWVSQGKSVREQTPKKSHIAQPPKLATVQRPTPWPILLIYSTKNRAIKNTIEPKSTPGPRAQYGRASRRSCKGWILEGGPSSQWTRDGDFLWRGIQQSSIWIPEAAVGSSFLYFSFEYFWMRCGVFFVVEATWIHFVAWLFFRHPFSALARW